MDQMIRPEQVFLHMAPVDNLLLQGAQSAPSGLADEAYFAGLRSGINSR
jgi:hypothetical protein